MNSTDTSMEALDRIYACYDALAKGFTTACTRGCSLCCTRDVTITSLEGRYLIRHVQKMGAQDLLSSLDESAHPGSAGKIITTNAFARLCFSGKDLPEDAPRSAHGPCKLLSSRECPIYEARPFGCRCFFSTQPCEKEGCAVVDPYLLTLNTVFLQFIEHVDAGGFSGRLEPVLVALTRAAPSPTTSNTPLDHLTANHPIAGLLIPPEHRSGMKPIVADLARIVRETSGIGSSALKR